MGTEFLTMPPIPGLAIVAEVIRLADAAAASSSWGFGPVPARSPRPTTSDPRPE